MFGYPTKHIVRTSLDLLQGGGAWWLNIRQLYALRNIAIEFISCFQVVAARLHTTQPQAHLRARAYLGKVHLHLARK